MAVGEHFEFRRFWGWGWQEELIGDFCLFKHRVDILNHCYSQAHICHQLGIIAQKLREFEQARNDYQQALKIFIEFGDRYSQAAPISPCATIAKAFHFWGDSAMTPQLQQIFHNLNQLTQSERWQVFDYLVNQLKNSLTRFDVFDRPSSQQPPKLSPQEIFASTQGSWSHQTRDEIDAQLASQRQLDWGE